MLKTAVYGLLRVTFDLSGFRRGGGGWLPWRWGLPVRSSA